MDGFTTALVRDAGFLYSYFLWFEDSQVETYCTQICDMFAPWQYVNLSDTCVHHVKLQLCIHRVVSTLHHKSRFPASIHAMTFSQELWRSRSISGYRGCCSLNWTRSSIKHCSATRYLLYMLPWCRHDLHSTIAANWRRNYGKVQELATRPPVYCDDLSWQPYCK